MQNSRRHEINVRLAIVSILCDLDRSRITELLGALNVSPPIQEHEYREAQEFNLNYVGNPQEQPMIAVVEEVIVDAGGERDSTISGDGVWLTQGFSNRHGISALC